MSIKETRISLKHSTGYRMGIVADPVIEAIANLEFEDGLRT